MNQNIVQRRGYRVASAAALLTLAFGCARIEYVEMDGRYVALAEADRYAYDRALLRIERAGRKSPADACEAARREARQASSDDVSQALVRVPVSMPPSGPVDVSSSVRDLLEVEASRLCGAGPGGERPQKVAREQRPSPSRQDDVRDEPEVPAADAAAMAAPAPPARAAPRVTGTDYLEAGRKNIERILSSTDWTASTDGLRRMTVALAHAWKRCPDTEYRAAEAVQQAVQRTRTAPPPARLQASLEADAAARRFMKIRLLCGLAPVVVTCLMNADELEGAQARELRANDCLVPLSQRWPP